MRAKTVRAVGTSKSSGTSKSRAVRKTGVKKEALLNTLARGVGRAAGVIANAAQALSSETIAVVHKKEAFVVKKGTSMKGRRKAGARLSRRNRKTAKAATR